MKIKLLVQSLSPLALLTIIRNFSFVTKNSHGGPLPLADFVYQNCILLIVLGICAVWVLLSVLFYISFGVYIWHNENEGYDIYDVQENEEAGLNFFLTLIIPLLLDKVDTIQGAIAFGLILFFISLLLYRTKLFYANPVLAVLGYRIYEFSFKANNIEGSKRCIGLCRQKLNNDDTIEYINISDNVFYVRRMKV